MIGRGERGPGVFRWRKDVGGMASLCTKCLAELQFGSQVCSQCGAENGAPPKVEAGSPLAAAVTGRTSGNVGTPGTVPPGASLPSPPPEGGFLPPVVPPLPPTGGPPVRAPSADTADPDPAFALKWEPPPFERTIDPASPQSLLGPSSHRAPGSTPSPAAPGRGATSGGAPGTGVPGPGAPGGDDSGAGVSATEVSATQVSATEVLTTTVPGPQIESGPEVPSPPIPVAENPSTEIAGKPEPARTSAPTPQELLFGSLQGNGTNGEAPAKAPAHVETPAPAQARTFPVAAAPRELDPARPTGHHKTRSGFLGKLVKQKALIPVAVLLVVAAVVASVMATGGSSAPTHTALTKPTTGTRPPSRPPTHVKTKAASGHHPVLGPTLSIALRSPSDDPRPDISVSIGNDAPIHVVLDTGSVGLRVFSNLVPGGYYHGIHITGQSDSIEYVDGTQFTGPVAQARVHIGKLITGLLSFQLVQSVTCDPTIPDCPASGGAAQFEADGVDGIMGVGLTGPYQGDPTTNPLLSLPAPYRDSWSIAMGGGGTSLPAPGTLVLGAHDPTAPAADFSLQQEGASSDGMATWNDQFNLCWNVGGLTSCELSVFDSGSDLTVLGGTGFSSVPTDNPGGIGTLTTGTSVQASQEIDGNPLWSFSSGGGPMQTVIVEPEGANWVNSGVQAFYSFTVTYDEVNGEIFLS